MSAPEDSDYPRISRHNSAPTPSGDALYRTIFETTGAATMIIRNDTVIELVNREFCGLSGFRRDEIEGIKSWTDFVAPEDVKRMLSYHEARRDPHGEAPTRYEFVFVDRAGRRRTVLAAVDMIPDSDRSVASLIDVTMQREDALRARQYGDRLRALHRSAVAISDVSDDPQGVYAGTLSYLAETVAFDTASVQLVAGEELHIVAARGFPHDEEVVGLRFPLQDDFPNSRVVHQQTTLTWENVSIDFPHFRSESKQWQSGHICSWLGVPLVARGEPLGVIALDRRSIDPFSDQDAQLVFTFAGHVAMAIHNARLFEVRKAYERKLVVANRHKETLLQELHHRVKNNMQLISSLLRIRASTLSDPAALSALQDVEVRILAMAAVHERLYEPGSNGRVDLGAYICGLATDILSSHAPVTSSIQTNFAVDRVDTSVDVSVPVGLMVSELVLNVVKHAFSDNQTGLLSIELGRRDGEVQLSVQDNGGGLDPETAKDTESHLGLHLVHTLITQLHGNAEVFVKDGTRWEISFPLPDATKN